MSTPPPQSHSSNRLPDDNGRTWKTKYNKLQKEYEQLIEKQRTQSEDSRISEQASVTSEMAMTSERPATSYTRPHVGDEKLIPSYNPDEERDTVEEWVNKVDEVARRYSWNDNDTLRLATLRLRGHAREWFERQTCIDMKWMDLAQSLTKKFKTVIRFSNLLQSAANYEARSGQSLGDYCFCKLQKLQALRCNINDECMIDAVIGGIRDENIARTLSSMRFADTDDMYSKMRTMGNVPLVTHKRTYEISDSVANKKRPSPTVRDSLQQQNPRVLQVLCYNCKQTGHLARNCPRPKLECRKCHKLGHLAAKCSEVPQST